MVLEYPSGIRMNCKKWTERPGNLWQWIKNFTEEVMLHGCVFLGKMVEEELLNVKTGIKNEEIGLGWYIKNNIESLLVAVRTSKAITHKKQLTLKSSRKLNKKNKKKESMDW